MSNFNEMMNEFTNQMRSEKDMFVVDPINNQRVYVSNAEAILGRPLSKIELKMLMNIQNVDQHSWDRGAEGGLKTGLETFDYAFEGGVQPGLILIAAAPNVGKSAFMLKLAKGMSELNENVYVSYHSLDDANNDLMPRYIANDQRITIGQAKTPKKYEDNPDIMEKRNQGIKNLYRRVETFGMFDSNDATSVEGIEKHIKEIIMSKEQENVRIVICIDSFNDLEVESETFRDNDMKNAYVSKKLKSWSTNYNAVVMCTAHLRKTNGKRPMEDDLKETITLRYEATMVCLLYNEVGIKEENAQIHWLDEDSEGKKPVLEVKFAKNKHSSYKGTKFYEFIPEYSEFIEGTDESNRRYASLIYQT